MKFVKVGDKWINLDLVATVAPSSELTKNGPANTLKIIFSTGYFEHLHGDDRAAFLKIIEEEAAGKPGG